MTIPTNMLVDHPAAAAFGAAGLACQLIWPLFSARRAMLGIQFGIGTNYGVQYALLDAWSGAGVCALGATQTLIAMIAGERPWLRHLGLGFIPLVGLVSALTWTGAASALAMVACCLIMIGRMQGDTVRMRIIMLAASPFGIGHDLTVGAAAALTGAVLSALVGAVALRREWQARRGVPDGQPQPA